MEPIIIADFEKNKKEIFRVEISEFKDKKLLNIRVWYQNTEGEYAPSAKGIAIGLDKFNDLKAAILKAEKIIAELN